MSTPAEKCAAGKRVLAGKKLAALTVCDAKAVSKGALVDPGCDAKATSTFMTDWGNVEAKGGCSTTNDEGTTETLVDGVQGNLEHALQLTGFPSTCTAAKFHAAGKKGACKLRCSAKAALKALPLTDPTIVTCLAVCSTKFSAAFTKAEAKKTGACHTRGDAITIEAAIDDTFVLTATADLIPCPAGQIGCSQACVDPMTDPHDCSRCGEQCLQNEICSGGLCTCAFPNTLCGSLCEIRLCHCVDLEFDPNNCGSCGFACPASAPSCNRGVCICPTGNTLCGSVCADLLNDRDNCGSCGTVCSGGTSCNPVCDPSNPDDCRGICCYPSGTDLGASGNCNLCCRGQGCRNISPSGPPDEVCN